jgi:hypothetical protein
MVRRIIVLDKSPKVWKMVCRGIKGLPDCRAEGYVNLAEAKATLTDPRRYDIRVFVLGDVVPEETAEARSFAKVVYMEGYTVIGFSANRPPLAEIRDVVRTEPFDKAIEEEVRDLIERAIR